MVKYTQEDEVITGGYSKGSGKIGLSVITYGCAEYIYLVSLLIQVIQQV